MSIGTRPVPAIAEGWAAEAGASLRAHAGLGALILAYSLIALAAGAVFGDASRISLWLYGSLFSTSAIIVGMAFLIARAIHIMFIVRPDQLMKTIVTDLRSNCLTRARLFNALPVIVLLLIFNSVFTSIKAMIPLMHPYNWDATLMAWDTAVHFGVPPWRLLQPALAYPVITGAINVFYNLWFFVLAGCWFWQAFTDRDPRLRMQFFVTFVLCFALLGNLAAVFLASGGPCFYGHFVTGQDPYAPLMQYLHQASLREPLVWSVGMQEVLWKIYAENGFEMGSGISAMPSMHLAGATLFAALGWRTGRAPGMALTGYAAVIMIGSVHLGWHYAIDGYVAIFGTLAIWRVAGSLINRYDWLFIGNHHSNPVSWSSTRSGRLHARHCGEMAAPDEASSRGHGARLIIPPGHGSFQAAILARRFPRPASSCDGPARTAATGPRPAGGFQ